ncbi:isoleucine--tRNA ligase [Desulfovibrionales bacterium]
MNAFTKNDIKKNDFKKTLMLPRTDFPMKANLSQNEPKLLEYWESIDAYGRMVAADSPCGLYVLHDGPPYANGHIHLGTALNKVLKDIIIKSRNMAGFRAEYVPGWDCHGLPIEHKVEQELKEKNKKDLSPSIIRKRCRKYANRFLDIQRKEFKRLGVFGTWDTPYLTMHPSYEAATARELSRFMAAGSVYRAKKPIYWCLSCQTALAEAEVEYANHHSPSIYVRFLIDDPDLARAFPQVDSTHAYVVIWTTTPWTIPDNMAVAVHPEYDYVLWKQGEDCYILAKDLVETCARIFKWDLAEGIALATAKGAALEGLVASHPFYDRISPIVLSDYVVLYTGTGCVHTAPGHGREDYETGLKYGLNILSPLDNAGRFIENVPLFAGLTVFDANPKVIETIKAHGHLLAKDYISHSYPHCWRCKKPVIVRATTQWFISMAANNLRMKAIAAIEGQVRWLPAWGKERILNMIASRPDWCISRQRIWGVPIVALHCEACNTAWFDADWVARIVECFAAYPTGCDYWFDTPVEQLIPTGLTCPNCGASRFRKETDTLDVWLDSGTSFAAVLEQRPECVFPADLYLEGSDQHRGWFHSSLLAALGTRGTPPYRTVLTHGYVVDGEGKKMSKSMGNVIAPQEIIDKYGAEILRIWVASVDYTEDIRISGEILDRLVDAYRRIRNTCRFLLGNLNDFSATDALASTELMPLDRYALDVALATHSHIQQAYKKFEFHRVFNIIHTYCVTNLSAFALDILKDRLYISGRNSRERRSAQTLLWKTLMLLVKNMAPILSFTAEEVYSYLPDGLRPVSPTVFAITPSFAATQDDSGLTNKDRQAWELILKIRAEVTKAIEPQRKSGKIGHSLDAQVTLYLDKDFKQALEDTGADLRELCIVSQLRTANLDEAPVDTTASELPGLKIVVALCPGKKCERCWVVAQDITNFTGPELDKQGKICGRCATVLNAT